MKSAIRQLTLAEWEARYPELAGRGLREPFYGGPLGRHVAQGGNLRLRELRFDSSPAALRLWNFLLSEEDRLQGARRNGQRLVGAMKDLGTIPVIAFSLPNTRAFYPDGAWWIPCLMECTDHLFIAADRLGVDASFCPVRAMLGAFESEAHFPRPDVLVCSAGAVCDDFSAIAQRLERLGRRIAWWEMPRRRTPEPGERNCELPGGLQAPKVQVDCVRAELERIAALLCEDGGCAPSDLNLGEGIAAANRVRRQLAQLRQCAYSAPAAPLPAVEMLVAEMLALHFCSDREESFEVLAELTVEAESRVSRGDGVLPEDAVRVFWVNPVADLRAMNLLEECGGRLAGSDFMFTHALDLVPENLPPFDALARVALADPMAGPAIDRAKRIVSECRSARAEAVVISRIPGASHCPWEAESIRQLVTSQLELPVAEVEVPPVSDALALALKTRLEAMVEVARDRRCTVN